MTPYEAASIAVTLRRHGLEAWNQAVRPDLPNYRPLPENKPPLVVWGYLPTSCRHHGPKQATGGVRIAYVRWPQQDMPSNDSWQWHIRCGHKCRWMRFVDDLPDAILEAVRHLANDHHALPVPKDDEIYGNAL